MKLFVQIKKAGYDSDKGENEQDNQNSPIGTKKAGYAGPDDGPFQCSRCVHYKEITEDEGRCNQPDVLADEEVEKDDDGKAKVDTRACCTYFNNGGY